MLKSLPWYLYLSVACGDISTRGFCPKYNYSIFKILFYFLLIHGAFRNELEESLELVELNKITIGHRLFTT